jgi:hypothetical protein
MKKNYRAQLEVVFNRSVEEPEWYWDLEAVGWEDVSGGSSLVGFEFLEALLLKPKLSLRGYSEDQIGLGLNYIFNNCCSNMTHYFKDADVGFERRRQALGNLFLLFRDVLNPLCLEVLSAGAQVRVSRLNMFCYMFWDITPLSVCWEGDEGRAYYEAIAGVMERCLYLKNIACVESGLHGLGHLMYSHPDIAKPIVERFLAGGGVKNEVLMGYAVLAADGKVM